MHVGLFRFYCLKPRNCPFKGTVAWFLACSIMSTKVISFWFWSKIRRDWLNFKSNGVFSIHGKMFLAIS
jgi:hypothetical protein